MHFRTGSMLDSASHLYLLKRFKVLLLNFVRNVFICSDTIQRRCISEKCFQAHFVALVVVADIFTAELVSRLNLSFRILSGLVRQALFMTYVTGR